MILIVQNAAIWRSEEPVIWRKF